MESHLEQAILGIVALAASGARQVTTPCRSLAVIILGDGEGHPTTAGDEKHSEPSVLITLLFVPGCGERFHDCSTAA
jgi:hypothetical protein